MDGFSNLRPNVGVTIVPITFMDGELKALIYQRHPDADFFPGHYAFPNGFMNIEKHKTLDDAANDALREKTDSELSHMEEFHVFSGDHIDPRRITINVGYLSIHRPLDISFGDGESTPTQENTKWISADKLLSLKSSMFAFNHYEVFEVALKKIRSDAKKSSICLKLANDTFTIPEVLLIAKSLTGLNINEKTFRSRLKQYDAIINTGKERRVPSRRPSALYEKNPNHDGILILT